MLNLKCKFMVNIEDLKEMKEMEISSQDFIKDEWKLLKKYKDKDNHYYALIECCHCGNRKVVNYYNFINLKTTSLKCLKCKYLQVAKEEIGKTFGTIKVIALDRIEEIVRQNSSKSDVRVYYLTECLKCGKQSIRLRNITQFNKSNGCKYCNSAFEESSYNNLLHVYKSGAKDRNINWELTNEEFLSLVTQNCYYCGEEPYERPHDTSSHKLKVMGIDRLNSNLSYSLNNCVPCCTKCNLMKQALSKEEFLGHITKIYKHLY